jgi:hypothetical protein
MLTYPCDDADLSHEDSDPIYRTTMLLIFPYDDADLPTPKMLLRPYNDADLTT